METLVFKGLIVIFFHCGCPCRFDVVLLRRSNQTEWHVLQIFHIFCIPLRLPQCIPPIDFHFFSVNGHCFQYWLPSFVVTYVKLELPSCSFLTGMGWKLWMWCFCCPLGVTFFLHAFLRRPQLSNLIFSRYEVMYNVFCIVADVEVTWKVFPIYFLLQ